MKTIIKWIVITVVAVSAIFFAYSYKTKQSTTSHNTLRLGISADNPPFTFVKDKTFVGFEIDLAHALASQMKYNLEILDLDFGGLIPAVKNNVVDIVISGFNITEERKKNVAFSDPYYFGETGILSHKPITQVSDLANYRLGVQHGSIWENEAKSIAAATTGVKVIGFHRINQMVQELHQLGVNAIVIETAVAQQIAAIHQWLSVSTIPSSSNENGIGVVLPQNSPLISQINAALAVLKENGTLKELTEKWFSKNPI